MKHLFYFCIILVSSNSLAESKWLIEMTWSDSWGSSGPGISAISDGGLKILEYTKDHKKKFACPQLKLLAVDAKALETRIQLIPVQIPGNSTLTINGRCDDDPQVSLIVRQSYGFKQFIYPKQTGCRVNSDFPDWLVLLDTELWSIFDKVKDCAKSP